MDQALVYNATPETVTVQAFGNWFTFKPGQYKVMQKDIAEFLMVNKAYLGLTGLPEFITEGPGEDATPEAMKEFEERKKEAIMEAKRVGTQRRVAHLTSVVRNLEVGLQRDLDQANLKINSTLMATDGELAAYKELAKYKAAQTDESSKRAAEIAELQKQIKAGE